MTTKLISPLAPLSTCVLVASGCVTNAPITDQGGYVWVGLVSASVSACATFFGSTSATAGRKLWHLAVGPCNVSSEMVGPFFSPSGVYVRLSGVGASALVAKDTER